jgi:hypothetical protein
MTKINRSDIFVRDEKGPTWFNDFLESLAEEKESSVQDVIDAIQYKRSETVQGVVDEYKKMVGLNSIVEDIKVEASTERPLYEEHIDLTKEEFTNRVTIGEVEDNVSDPVTYEEVENYLLTNDDWIAQQDEEIQNKVVKETFEAIEIMQRMHRRRRERKSTASFHPISVRHARMLDEKQDALSVIEKNPKLREDIRSLCEHSGGTKNTHSILNHLREKLGKDLISYSDSDLIEYIEKAKKEYQGDTEEQSADVGRVGTDTEDHPEDNAADYITHGKGS